MGKHFDVDRVRGYIRAHIHSIDRVEDVSEGLGVDAVDLRRSYYHGTDERLWAYFMRCRQEAVLAHIGNMLNGRSAVGAGYLDSCLEHYVEQLPEPDASWPEDVQRVIGYVHASLFSTAVERVDEILLACGARDPRFPGAFKARLGESVKAYIRRHRIELAKLFLQRSRVPVLEIALALGYPSNSTFTQAFREVTHQSPTSYRRLHAEN